MKAVHFGAGNIGRGFVGLLLHQGGYRLVFRAPDEGLYSDDLSTSLAGLNRSVEQRPDKRPMLSDLRESGAIEQDADAVIGLYCEGYYNRECEDPNAAEAIILKNRRGETGTVFLRWLPEYTSYVNDERRRNEDEY